MIRFQNGHELTFCNGSGALAFDGKGWWWEQPLRWTGLLDPSAFTVVAKTVTAEPKKGNLSLWHPWTCVQTLAWTVPNGRRTLRGAVNAVGLTNPGIQHWVEHDYPKAKKMGYKVAASVKPNNVSEALMMRTLLDPLDLAYVELNISCPNVDETLLEVGIVEQMWMMRHPLVLKLSHDQVNTKFVTAVEPYVQAFHAINSIPWDNIFTRKKSPIQKYQHNQKGGVSGQFIHNQAVEAVRNLNQMTYRPIIGGGGIYNIEDVRRFEDAGAEAFSIGTLFMTRPWMPNRIVKQYHCQN